MKQEERESLKDFMVLFNREELTIDNPDEKVVLPAFLGEVWPL
jgi:hypothetical protein